MQRKKFKVGEILSVIMGRDFIPGGNSRVVSFMTNNSRKYCPTNQEIKKCRKFLREQFDFNDNDLKKELAILNYRLDKIDDEKKVQGIINNWLKEIREKYCNNKRYFFVETIKEKKVKKENFVPPY